MGWTATTRWLSSKDRPILVNEGGLESINRDIIRFVSHLDIKEFVLLGHHSIGTGVRGLERTSSCISADENISGRGQAGRDIGLDGTMSTGGRWLEVSDLFAKYS